MTKSEVLNAGTLFLVIAVLSSLASIKVGKPDRESAVAAALKGDLLQFIPEDEMVDKNPPLVFSIMCVESDLALDVKDMAASLSDTIIRPIPVEDCTSKTVQSDFGIFTALTTYFDKSGHEAGHFKVVKADCANTSECIVDLDWLMGGDRYVMKRRGRVWEIDSQSKRWIV